MNLVRVYTRVLALLGEEAKLAWLLALANLALAGAQFAEPVLFGRIIDALTKSLSTATLAPLIAAWVGFGLFTILCSAFVALHADRLAHRRRQVVLSSYFEHVLQLPLSFHGAAHSGRLMKVMISGTDALWNVWIDFFRDYFSALALVFVLLPFSLLINWRLGLLLIRPAHRSCHSQNRAPAEDGRAALFRSRRTRLRRLGQCRAGAGICPRR